MTMLGKVTDDRLFGLREDKANKAKTPSMSARPLLDMKAAKLELRLVLNLVTNRA